MVARRGPAVSAAFQRDSVGSTHLQGVPRRRLYKSEIRKIAAYIRVQLIIIFYLPLFSGICPLRRPLSGVSTSNVIPGCTGRIGLSNANVARRSSEKTISESIWRSFIPTGRFRRTCLRKTGGCRFMPAHWPKRLTTLRLRDRPAAKKRKVAEASGLAIYSAVPPARTSPGQSGLSSSSPSNAKTRQSKPPATSKKSKRKSETTTGTRSSSRTRKREEVEATWDEEEEDVETAPAAPLPGAFLHPARACSR